MCGTVNALPAHMLQGGQGGQGPTIPLQVHNQQLGQHAAMSVGQPGPPPSGRKRALLIGINYPGTQAELRGCINDVLRMKGLISQLYGFPTSPDSMMVLTDDQYGSQAPTRMNMMRGFRWLVEGARPGDCLFLHYSGHGAQQEDPSYSEEDGYDETLCPTDFNSAGMIVDDEIFDMIVASLPPGVKLTAVLDCCHSGTGLDLPFTYQRGGWMEEDNPAHSQGDVLLISGCQDDQCSSDGGGGYGRPMGAMTTALCNTLERNPLLDHTQLIEELRRELRNGGFEQIPSLTASQRFNVQKQFTPVDGIEGNTNAQIGRQFRKKKHPKNPAMLNGGLGQMLMAGAAGFMIADMMGGMGGMGDIGTGLAIAGVGGMDAMAGGMDAMGGGMGMMGDAAGAVGGFFGGGDGGDGGWGDGDGGDGDGDGE